MSSNPILRPIATSQSDNGAALFRAEAPFEVSSQSISLFEKFKTAFGTQPTPIRSPGQIIATAIAVSFPNYLSLQQTLGGPIGETTFLLAELVDFEIVPASGSKKNYIPRHFRIETKNQNFELVEHHFKCTISMQDEARLITIMRSKLAYKGSDSPFSFQAEKKRTAKASMKKFAGITLIAAILGNVFLTVLNPPLYIFSAFASILSAAIFLGVLVTLLLKETLFYDHFAPGPGRELKFTELLISVVSILSLSFLFINNFGPPKSHISASYFISQKYTTRSKGKTYYKADFAVSPRIGSPIFDFNETTQMKVNQSEYSQIQIGKSQFKIEGALGTFGIPIIKSSKLLILPNESNP